MINNEISRLLQRLTQNPVKTEEAERYHRICRVYDALFTSGNSNDIDFSSFDAEDVEKALEDVAEYDAETDDPGVNAHLVLEQWDQTIGVRIRLMKIPPCRRPVTFF